MKAKTIKTERLILKQLSLDHLTPEYVNWMNDSQVIQYLESGGSYTLQELKIFLKDQYAKDIYFWAIHLKSTGKHIGNIKIDPINEASNSGEYGILLGDKNEWGKGYAKEASLAIIFYCFETIKLNCITLGVVDANRAAVKLYESIGFVHVAQIDNTRKYGNTICKTLRMAISK